MSKVAKKIDPKVIAQIKSRIDDPNYMKIAVEIIASIISSKIFFEIQR